MDFWELNVVWIRNKIEEFVKMIGQKSQLLYSIQSNSIKLYFDEKIKRIFILEAMI